uniref:Uncharacterized protein n=1 Tax=Siphoviridae sp. ctTnV63 TaxID=2825523 RepID=A0A8S5NX95_9CAUD|nr:MAG TPA: hypothetical protein [Siphoviridae sp. ctTnV63]
MNIFTILILTEILIAIFGAWCILNEEKLIKFEDKLSKRIKEKIAHK